MHMRMRMRIVYRRVHPTTTLTCQPSTINHRRTLHRRVASPSSRLDAAVGLRASLLARFTDPLSACRRG